MCFRFIYILVIMSQSNQQSNQNVLTRKQEIKNMIKRCKRSQYLFNMDQSQDNFKQLCKDFSLCPQAQEQGLTDRVFSYIVHMETYINIYIMRGYDAENVIHCVCSFPKFYIDDGIQKCSRCGLDDHYKNGVVADFSDDENV